MSEVQNTANLKRSRKLLGIDNMLEPAHSLIEKFGGSAATSKIVGCHQTQVNNWRRPRPRGTGGIIPHWYHAKLLAAAPGLNIEVTVADLYHLPELGPTATPLADVA